MTTRSLLLIALAAGGCAAGDLELGAGQAQLIAPDAGGTPTRSHIIGIHHDGVPSRVYSGVLVDDDLVITSSRALPAGTTRNDLWLEVLDDDGNPVVGTGALHSNVFGAGPLLLIQSRAALYDPSFGSPTRWLWPATIDARTGNLMNVALECPGFGAGGYLGGHAIVVTSSDTEATVQPTGETQFEAIDIGTPCFSSPGVVLGVIDRLSGGNVILARILPAAAWIDNMGHLADVRLRAEQGSIAGQAAGPYALYVRANGNDSTRMCLDVPGASPNPGAINQWSCHYGDNQLFWLDWQGDTAHPMLVSDASGLCIDTPNASTVSGVGLQQYGCHAGTNQRFTRESPGGLFTIPPAKRYRHFHASSLCMSARTGTEATGGGLRIRQMTCVTSPLSPTPYHQRWHESWRAPS